MESCRVPIVAPPYKVLITGGAGFIGSHLADDIMERGANVCILDNLSTGRAQNLKRWFGDPKFTFLNKDLLNMSNNITSIKECDIVFHLAANPDVRISSVNPEVHFRQNILATFNLLEVIRKAGSNKTLVYTSSSTVYGDADIIPTSESYPPHPISVYGASKLASEALIVSYARTYGFKAIIYRLANIVGFRSKHGVIHDFIMKLKRDSNELEILGDGTQRKSYLHISDCISAMLLGLDKTETQIEIFNIGSEDWITVKEIAKIISEEIGLKNVRFRFTGGVDSGRGWKSDVKYMLLDISKIKSIGWKPKHNSAEAVRLTTRSLLGN